jgi:reactive chlorine resistance protein C
VAVRPLVLRSSAGTRGIELERLGIIILRYALAFILLYFGLFKFTPTEARAIQPLLEHSPLLSGMYSILSVDMVSRVIGCAELAIAGLILARPWSHTLSGIGSLAAVGMFLMTLSFLVTTPGMWQWVDGFPAPSAAGGFLLKDVFLLGAAVVTAGEARRTGGQADGRTVNR